MLFDLIQPDRMLAQSPTAGVLAAALERHLAVLRADSMRDTTGGAGHSAGLSRTARYVAGQFNRLGLRPGAQRGNDTLWLQLYPAPGQHRVEAPRSHLELSIHFNRSGRDIATEDGWAAQEKVHLSLDTAAYFSEEGPPPLVPEIYQGWFETDPTRNGVILLSGHYTAATIPDSALPGNVVLYLPSADVDAATRRQVLARLYATSAGVVLIREDDPAGFAQRLGAARVQPVPLVDDYLQPPALPTPSAWIVEVRADALQGPLTAAGVDLEATRLISTPCLRLLPSAEVRLDLRVAGSDITVPRLVMAPNVVAVLDGADSMLKQEYIVVSAPMDMRMSAHNEPASGIAGLLALAEAFQQPGARPRRSLIFLATSGTPAGAWGSYYFASLTGRLQLNLSNMLYGTIANLSLDHLGQSAESGNGGSTDSDMVIVAGAEAVELPHAPAWLAAAHGELGLAVRAEESLGPPMPVADSLSALDHVAFLQNAIPSLYLHGGPSARRVTPDGAALDPLYTARVTRLAFYLVEDLANAATRARLNNTGRRVLWENQVPSHDAGGRSP